MAFTDRARSRFVRWPWGRSDREAENAETPSGPPFVPAGFRLYAIGDVHGRDDLLAALFARIDGHKAQFPVARPIEIVIGDCIDRGPDSRGVIQRLIDRAAATDLVPLLGNHEDMLLRSLRDAGEFDYWLTLGGIQTLRSYGILGEQEQADPQRSIEQMRRKLIAHFPPEHFTFLSSWQDCFAIGGYFFAHAGVRPGTPLSRQTRQDLLWLREEFLSSDADFGAVVVHGHTPVERIDIRPNRINIDTGAYLTGNLTCLVMEGTSLAVL